MHEHSVAFSGDTSRAFNLALQTLLPLGFEIQSQGSHQLVLTGPGYRSTRQNPLLGISRVTFTAERGSLKGQADLAGLERFERWLLIFLTGLGAFDALVLAALWYFIPALRAQRWFLVVPVLVFAPWLFIAPLLQRLLYRAVQNALATLLERMAAAG